MELNFKLQEFEGPLDLLLHLLDRNKVDILDIPIAEITSQYFDYMQAMKEEDLDISSEFLVMAATLVDIKSRMLLPSSEDDGEEDGTDPREELVRQLMEYKMYKYVCGQLKELEEGAGQSLYKRPSVPREVSQYEPPVDPVSIVGDRTIEELSNIFLNAMKQSEERKDPIRSSFGTIHTNGIPLDDKVRSLREYARQNGQFSFKALLRKTKSKDEVIVTFLAVLEMMRSGDITARQDATFGDILICSRIAA